VVRGRIALPAVSGQLLGDGRAYLRLGGLKKNTVERLDALIDELRAKGARRLVLDLRGCPGGLLDAAIAVADRFLPPGRTVVTLRRRAGENEVKRTRAENPADRLPLVVLVDAQTSSGAEIIAAALQHGSRAQIVGAPTLGKGTVEDILELPGGWALKLTVARFFAPDGRPMQGQGVTPDFPIAGDPASQRRRYFSVTADPENDPPLAAALRLLRLSGSAPATRR
jgi:carboxyl-terminal processing protease